MTDTAEPIARDVDEQKLAVLGGPKAVSLKRLPWPAPTDIEIEAVRNTLIQAREEGDMSAMCSHGGGGPGEQLEEWMKQFLPVEYAVATSGAGPALHIACMCALEMGDEAITSPFSWGQTTSCILQAGGVPIFADIDPETLTLDPDAVEAKITPYTKAIVVVHIGGIPADMDRIMAIADKHGLVVIEDCAQAHGSTYKGRQVGTFGHFGCFSLGSGKNIASGDAGVLVTQDYDLFEEALLLGMHPARTNREIKDEGRRQRIDSLIYTYRVNQLSASLAVAQLDRLEELNYWRRKTARDMAERLEGVPGIRPLRLPEHLDPAWHRIGWSFVAEEVPGVSREQYVKALQAEGVPINPGYVGTPIHVRLAFQQKQTHYGRGYPWSAHPQGESIVYRQGDCPIAEKCCAERELTMLGGWANRDITPMLDQIAVAFAKVTSNLDKVGKIEV